MMRDTAKDIESFYSSLLSKKTPEERLKMSCSMFDLACTVIRSSFPKGLSDNEAKQRLFLRLYGADLEERVKIKVLKRMQNKAA